MAANLRLLAVAVDCQAQAAAFFIDGACKEVRTSRKVIQKASDARSALRLQIFDRGPDVLVFEDPATNLNKGESLAIIRALLQATQDEGLTIMRIPRPRLRESGYLDLEALAERLPDAAHHLPKARRYPHKAPKRQAVVEALALAAVALDELEGEIISN